MIACRNLRKVPIWNISGDFRQNVNGWLSFLLRLCWGSAFSPARPMNSIAIKQPAIRLAVEKVLQDFDVIRLGFCHLFRLKIPVYLLINRNLLNHAGQAVVNDPV